MAAKRLSTYSGASVSAAAPRTSTATTMPSSTQISTTTLLNALHTAYASEQPYRLDASTSLVLNTWLTATAPNGPIVDEELPRQAWEHARRRAEDACILLTSLHQSTPSLLFPLISKLPVDLPSSLSTALAVLRPFTHCVTPNNASAALHSALAARFELSLAGNVVDVKLCLSTSGIDIHRGLLYIPEESGHRAFDIFYYLLTAASTAAEREFLGLKDPSAYALLNRSGTYSPPSYLPSADDTAAAEDFRASLKAIGIKGSSHRGLLSTLAALLKLGETVGLLIDQEDLEEICEDVSGLLGIEPEVLLERCSTDEREAVISAIYEALVDWVLVKANASIKEELHRPRDSATSSDSDHDRVGTHTPRTDEDNGDTVTLTIVEIPSHDLGRAVAMRGVFDEGFGLLAEMQADGVPIKQPISSTTKDMQSALTLAAAELAERQSEEGSDKSLSHQNSEELLARISDGADSGSFLHKIAGSGSHQARFSLPVLLESNRLWCHLSLHPTDDPLQSLASSPSRTSAWSAATVSRQLRSWRLPEWSNFRNKSIDFTADFDIDEFCTRYGGIGCQDGRDGVGSWLLERGWSNGEVVLGNERVWIREGAWWEAESLLDIKASEVVYEPPTFDHTAPNLGLGYPSGYSVDDLGPAGSGFFAPEDNYGSRDNLLQQHQSRHDLGMSTSRKSIALTTGRTMNTMIGDYGLGAKGDEKRGQTTYYDDDLGHFTGGLDPELAEPKAVTTQIMSKSRRIWVAIVWALTFWIPSFSLRHFGRMKRPDVRMAWREKVVLCLLIFLLNAVVIFYIVEFGRLLCPNFDKAWNSKEVGYHQGSNDFWVSLRGRVYDITQFAKITHGDIEPLADPTAMQPFAGLNLDEYFPVPLSTGCSYLVDSDIPQLLANTTPTFSNGMHNSGPRYQPNNATKMHDIHWYDQVFMPKMKQYYKGDLVSTKKYISFEATSANRQWVILNDRVYDLTDYYHTKKIQGNIELYSYIPSQVSDIIQNGVGTDITSQWKANDPDFEKTLNCMDNVFYAGKTDFRDTPKCQVNNYILLAFTIILCAVILVKFLSALQFGTKHRPVPQDKFVICQVPAYTEGEDHLRKSLDSLTALQYDNKRKLICVVCDGVIIGGGNDRPTPKIVLDILGVDPKIDPPALPFRSVGQGSEMLNYGKVYSGLYEYEGNVVPYIVVVKVGKESEQAKAKPGNRGKRDSQLLLLSFLNRVHHRSPMSPLELEMFHQINNIIGVDPELYEYLFMVDADTSVREDSLTRLVASCANDAKIAGICGETSLENEEQSWWTMIQVYEYYISHHLAKAFESLFGSVTCLPGCFCMYRLRTADKGRPLIISDKVIRDYDIGDVDTLHKKNLLSLGEDRYLTTIMTRHFPQMSYKFVPDAFANTAAPDTWGVLLSQRRRWINSTIHNLAELVWLKDLCGFCCFSMRFVVFIDLFGTIILPATCGYLGYLIYRVATHSGQFPLISIVMIAAVYGFQAVIFIMRRQWQHVGWMIIYLLAFPIYSFILPIYSFWNQDNFTWGNTRIVIGEKGSKQIVAIEDEGFDPRSIPLQRWDDYATVNNLPGRRGKGMSNIEKPYDDFDANADGYEMADIRSMYSSARPASTVLTNFHNPPAYMPPHSPQMTNLHGNAARSSTISLGNFTDAPQYAATHASRQRPSIISLSSPIHDNHPNNPYNDTTHRTSSAQFGNATTNAARNSISTNMLLPPSASTENLIRMQSPPLRQIQHSPLGASGQARPQSTTLDFRTGILSPGQITTSMIRDAVRECLAEVNLDSVTKKQVRVLVEQRLQTELGPEMKAFLDREIDEQLANM